jgi:hypothetical protein
VVLLLAGSNMIARVFCFVSAPRHRSVGQGRTRVDGSSNRGPTKEMERNPRGHVVSGDQ